MAGDERVIVVMGVAGAGKTTIGRKLAAALGYGFHDADELHSPENIAKMRQGIPLTDADRESWIRAIRAVIDERKGDGAGHVFACSALRQRHREMLVDADRPVRFVYLKGEPGLIGERLARRAGHFFDPALLASQFEALEEPEDALVVDIAQAPDAIVGRIVAAPGIRDTREGGDRASV